MSLEKDYPAQTVMRRPLANSKDLQFNFIEEFPSKGSVSFLADSEFNVLSVVWKKERWKA